MQRSSEWRLERVVLGALGDATATGVRDKLMPAGADLAEMQEGARRF